MNYSLYEKRKVYIRFSWIQIFRLDMISRFFISRFFISRFFISFSFFQVLNSETSKRPTSRSRMMPHAIGPQLTNKSSKSAPTVGDPSDGGPKEPPILVTPSESFRYPLDPCFVFLQLYHASFLGLVNERPQPLPDGEVSFSVFCKVVV